MVKFFHDSTPTFFYLKHITFRLNSKKRLRFCPTLIEELISAAPNVCHIASHTIADGVDDVDVNESSISVVLNEIEKLGKQSSIESLDLRDAGLEHIEHLERMGKNGLKLKSLRIEPELTVRDDRVQIQLATIFKDTLQHFKAERIDKNMLMEYPKMPNLKSLCLLGFCSSDPKPVNLNEKFPVLETLDISLRHLFEWDDFFSQFTPCSTLKTLSVDRSTMGIHTFLNIQTAFQNLTKLDIAFKDDGNEILRRIWTQMTPLESLTIWGKCARMEELELDSLLTGIPTKALKRIHHVVNGLDKMNVEDRRDAILKLRKNHCRLPAIGNLIKLKHLELNVTATGGVNERKQSLRSFASQRMRDGETYALSDLTGYLAFYSMNHLSHVEVKKCRFTKTCCEILTKETGLESWTFQNNFYGDIIPEFLRDERENQFN